MNKKPKSHKKELQEPAKTSKGNRRETTIDSNQLLSPRIETLLGNRTFSREVGNNPSSEQSFIPTQFNMAENLESSQRLTDSSISLQRQISRNKTETIEPSIPSLEGILNDSIEAFRDELAERVVPLYKFSTISFRLANAFAKGIGDEIWSLRARNEPWMKSRAKGGFSRSAIQRNRRYLATGVSELPSVFREGIIAAVKESADLVIEEIADWSIESSIREPISELGDEIGDLVGDLLSGDYCLPELIDQVTEDFIQKLVGEISSDYMVAFGKVVAGYAIDEGITELKTRELLEKEGFSKANELAEAAARKIKIENLMENIDEKISVGMATMKRAMKKRRRKDNQILYVHGSYRNWENSIREKYSGFKASYNQLLDQKRRLEEIGLLKSVFGEEDEKAITMIRGFASEASGLLFVIGSLLPSSFSKVSFEPERCVIRNYRRSL